MPRISSVKKRDATPSRNFFENRESVTYEDDISVAEKSAELAKKIQQDKQNEINDAVKKATNQLSKNKLHNNSVTNQKSPKNDLRNSTVTKNQAIEPSYSNNSVTTLEVNDNVLRNNSVTDFSPLNSVSVLESTPLNDMELDFIDQAHPITYATNLTETNGAAINDSNMTSVTNHSELRNSSVTEYKHDKSFIRNKSVTNHNELRNSSVTNPQNSPAFRNTSVTNSVTNHKQLRNTSETNSVTNSVTVNRSFYNLIGDAKKIVFYIGELCYKMGSRITPPITFSELKAHLSISSNEVVRVTIHRLIKKDIFRKLEHKTGKGGYQVLEIREHVYKELVEIIQKNSVTSSVTHQSELRNNSVTYRVTDGVTQMPSSSISFKNINKELTTNEYPFNPADVPGQQQLGPQFDSDWQNVDITPLSSIGFTNNHLSQLFTKNELTPKQVQESINAFAFDLEENKRGEKIKTSPLNLFMGILKGGSPYNPPKNYESDEDRILREQVEAEREKLEKRQKMQSELRELKHQNWLLDLTIEKKLEILDVPLKFFEKMPLEAIQEGLKKHFEMKVL